MACVLTVRMVASLTAAKTGRKSLAATQRGTSWPWWWQLLLPPAVVKPASSRWMATLKWKEAAGLLLCVADLCLERVNLGSVGFLVRVVGILTGITAGTLTA